MFTNVRNRLLLIGALVVAAIFTLVPRTTTIRSRDESGVTRDRQVRKVPLKEGLDLQGGMHLALELDQSKQQSDNVKRDIDLAVTVLRKRIDEFGVAEPLIQKVGDERIVVELAGLSDPTRAKAIVQQSAFLQFRITDKSQALEKSLPAMDRALRTLGIGVAPGAPKKSAVSELLGSDTTKKKGDSTSAASDSGGVLAGLIAPGGMPGEYAVTETAFPRVDSLLKLPEVVRELPRNVQLFWSAIPTSEGLQPTRFLYALEDKALVDGSSLTNAVAQVDPLTNSPEVTFELDHAGGRKFGDGTGRHVGDFMAIVLDGRVQGRPPRIESRIDRNGRITLGGRTLQEAQDLALTLKAGALPIPLKIVEQQEVGASLGKDSIRGGQIAGLVGTALVILILLGYYTMSGVLASIGLGFYVLFTLGGLAALEATLTLPGLAGLILAIGIAVDANVLIFERIREEIDHGRTPRLAVEEGFKHAMPAIIDSNVTTIITALFLFQFGTGPVKGFAVTLIVGIVASMFTGIFIVRTLFMIWLQRGPAELSLGKLRLFHNATFDFIGVRRIAYTATAAIFVVGAALTIIRGGFNYSIEFTGGTLLQVKTLANVDVGQLRAGLDAQGVPGSEIQQIGGGNEFAIRARVVQSGTDANNTQLTAQAVRRALDAIVGVGKYEVAKTYAVGPKVGGELRQQAFFAIFLSFFAVLAYLAWRFEWRFGLAAIGATGHDIVATLLFIGAMKLEVSLVVVAGVLTMVGYSLNDTIIIFDRVRENLKKHQKMGFVDILNLSINETLPRSILTHGTVLATLLALTIFGGEVIRPFALVMFFGVFTGTFSSIYIAAPLLRYIEQRWPSAAVRSLRAGAPATPVRTKVQPVV